MRGARGKGLKEKKKRRRVRQVKTLRLNFYSSGTTREPRCTSGGVKEGKPEKAKRRTKSGRGNASCNRSHGGGATLGVTNILLEDPVIPAHQEGNQKGSAASREPLEPGSTGRFLCKKGACFLKKNLYKPLKAQG